MERILEINQYKNIGVEERQKLVLNKGLSKETVGGLVILIGGNNSGKSNVLEALKTFGNKRIDASAKTTLSFEEAKMHPKLKLKSLDEKNISSIVYSMKGLVDDYLEIEEGETKAVDVKKITSEILKEIEILIPHFSNRSYFRDVLLSMQDFKDDEAAGHVEDYKSYLDTIYKCYTNTINMGYSSEVNRINDMTSVNHLKYENLKEVCVSKETNDSKYFDKYGIKRIPQIVTYTDRKIGNNEFTTTLDRIGSNAFMLALFKVVGIDVVTIQNVYKNFNQLKNIGVFKKFELDVNKRLEDISKKFNKLYDVENEYEFSMRIETTQICIYLNRGEEPLNIDMQSTGFKWFFNLFFSLYIQNNLEAGDIIIMDEPATNLHVGGQRELRVFLKQFAIENGLTFVIATHTPFLIDIDYLDEIRVVSQREGHAYIENDFATMNYDDPDSLVSIKEALTVQNNILIEYDTKVVFVEGITDYNYLIAMKNKLNVKNLAFLPIKGLGNGKDENSKEYQQALSEKLIKIQKHNPILVVDGDKAGKAMQKVNEDSKLTVFTLSEVNEEFKEIESLFSAATKKKLGLDKSSNKSSSLKQQIVYNNFEFDKKTIDNFKELFNYIEELI